MEVAILFALVIGLMLIGVPIAISLGLSSMIFLLVYSDGSLASIAQTLFSAFDGHYTLLAIPFFILASSFMSTGGVAKRIIRFANACVGHFSGGLAIASVFACMMFAALSGSSPATVVAIGSIVIAGMREAGYTKEFAAGVICNAGTLGILIPPSIVMVVYAAATDVSVGRMFLAGVFPGLLAGFMLMLGIFVWAKVKGLPSQPFAGFREIFDSGKDAFWGLFLIIIILGGIYGGIFTPTEAAAVAAMYAFFIANFVYRDMGPLAVTGAEKNTSLLRKPQAVISAWFHPDTKKTLFEAGKLTIMLLFIIANALILKHVLTEEQIPQVITESMLAAGLGPITFLIVVNIILLIGGQFMEPSGLLIIVAPLVFPIAMELGIDPIHLGIIMVVNMEIGMITPPVGLNLFVTAGVAQMSVTNVVKAALPWVGIMFIFLIMVTYIPSISTWLPTTMMGPEIITR
jgi:C4-dicarboxylate transporter DctM subunit